MARSPAGFHGQRMTTRKRTPKDADTRLLQNKVPLSLWRLIETERSRRSVEEGRPVTQTETVIALLEAALKK